MVNTTPRRRALLLNEYPELTDYARTALRLHPRRGMPTAHHSSVGGPLLWPLDEPWPLCHGKHYGDGPTGPAEGVVLASVFQLFRHDLPDGLLSAPEWMFPDNSDVLQVLWCPNPHVDTDDPKATLRWRQQSQLTEVRSSNPALNVFTPDDADNLVPRTCVVHPELVQEYPPISIEEPQESGFAETMLGILPPHLELACALWTATGRPRENFDQHDYLDHCRVPGWKLGGWEPKVGLWPTPAKHCECGAPTFLLLGATSEDLFGPWQPVDPPGFRWGDPDDWDDNRPTDIWPGRNGLLWLLGCEADPTHPVLVYAE